MTANSGIYWVNHIAGDDTVGHANIDGSNPVADFFSTGSVDVCGLAADQSFLYWLNSSGALRIGRAALTGAGPDPNFITDCQRRMRCGGRPELPLLGDR